VIQKTLLKKKKSGRRWRVLEKLRELEVRDPSRDKEGKGGESLHVCVD
jgi:hypothetical protein